MQHSLACITSSTRDLAKARKGGGALLFPGPTSLFCCPAFLQFVPPFFLMLFLLFSFSTDWSLNEKSQSCLFKYFITKV